jgi:hypothetical protein
VSGDENVPLPSAGPCVKKLPSRYKVTGLPALWPEVVAMMRSPISVSYELSTIVGRTAGQPPDAPGPPGPDGVVVAVVVVVVVGLPPGGVVVVVVVVGLPPGVVVVVVVEPGGTVPPV